MHETAIGMSVVETVLAEAGKKNALKVSKVELEIGELTFLGTEQLEFWIRNGFDDTIAAEAEIVFRSAPARINCDACGYEGGLPRKEDPADHLILPVFSCPECGSTKITITSGRDAFIRSIEIETK